MAERKKRGAQPENSTNSLRDAEPKKKNKKSRWIVAAVAVLLLAVIVINPFGGKKEKDPTSDEQGIFLSNQPEFFSTVRPEKLQDAEADVADDTAKAAEYFENSLFVGDAQMVRIQNAKLQNEKISEILQYALFMTADSCTWQAMAAEFSGGPLTFNLYGDYVSLAEAVEKSGSKKIFLQIGREDLALGEAEAAVDNARIALRSLKQAVPDTEIVVLGITPNTASSEVFPNNDKIHLFNTGMETVCLEYGFRFMKSETVFPDGVLPDEYCLNPEGSGEDLNTEGALLWVTGLAETVSNPVVTAQPTAAPTGETVPDVTTSNESGTINAAGRKVSNAQ